MFLQAWDENHLLITTAIMVALQTFYFVVTWASRVEKVADFAAGTNFFIVAVLTLCFSEVRKIASKTFQVNLLNFLELLSKRQTGR